MVLEIEPREITFDSVKEVGQDELTLNNTCSNAVTYRFRLQSDCVLVENAKGQVEEGQTKTLKVYYDPAKNKPQRVVMRAQVKYSEINSSGPGEEQSLIIPIRFVNEGDMEDDLFKTPMNSEVSRPKEERWWNK